jgi:hypothetical protein
MSGAGEGEMEALCFVVRMRRIHRDAVKCSSCTTKTYFVRVAYCDLRSPDWISSHVH